MKSNNLLVLFTLLSTTVTTVTAVPWFTSNYFSRATIEKWRKYIYSSDALAHKYRMEMVPPKGSRSPLKLMCLDRKCECPKELKDADIKLYYANGQRMAKDTTWKQWLADSTGDLNQVEIKFLVNAGQCGEITVKTSVHDSSSIFRSSTYKWEEPVYSFGSGKRRDLEIIKPHEIKISAGKALKAAKSSVGNAFENGFQELRIQTIWWRPEDKEPVPAYVFMKPTDVGKYVVVYVNAADGQVAAVETTEGIDLHAIAQHLKRAFLKKFNF